MLAPQTVSTADTVVLPKPKGGPTDGFDAKQNSSIQETGPRGEHKSTATLRPDHFISARIWPRARPHQAMEDVQAALLHHFEALQGTFVDVAAAHLTLLVTRLDSTERMATAHEAFAEAKQAIEAAGVSRPVCLEFRGLSHFNHRVLYLDVVQDMELERLKHIAELVHASFSAHGLIDGLQAGRSEAFTPHLTVAKLSQLIKQGRGKSRHLNKSLKMLPQSAYEEMLDIEGGQSSVQSLDLCQMQGRAAGSYYKVISSLPLGDDNVAADKFVPAQPKHPEQGDQDTNIHAAP